MVTGDVPMGAHPPSARHASRLIMLVRRCSLRGLIPAGLAKGFGFSSPNRLAPSPVAVTPDELEKRGGTIRCTCRCAGPAERQTP